MRGVRSIVLGVIREALRERALLATVLHRAEAPSGTLLASWLDAEEIPWTAVSSTPDTRSALVLDPAPREILLLEGPRPGAECLPFGDLWGSRLRSGDPDAPLTPIECALRDVFEGGEGLRALVRTLPPDEAERIRTRLLRAAPLLRAPIVPKLSEWTIGIDPGL
ncbi:MAG: hypothetical protein RQ745_00885 [Longimicrobiales bacterium]|nr:hypothetical protein [Longimicrobiales bacterium]